MKRTQLVTALCISFSALILTGCETTTNRYQSLSFSAGQEVEVNYALDVETRKYITGEFVSINDQWVTISKPAAPGSNDQREKQFSINLDRVYMIQATQE